MASLSHTIRVKVNIFPKPNCLIQIKVVELTYLNFLSFLWPEILCAEWISQTEILRKERNIVLDNHHEEKEKKRRDEQSIV